MDETVLFPSYKFHLYDSSQNIITNTYLFSQNDQDQPQDLSSNIQIINQQIFPDDSVHSMKLKLSKAIGDKTQKYPHIDSMYFFMRQYVPSNILDIEKIYREITKNNTAEVSLQIMQKFFDNFSIDIRLKEEDLENFPKLLELIQEELQKNEMAGALQYVPIGFTYANMRTDYTFPVNPYLYDAASTTTLKSTVIIPYDHHVLLRYFPIFQNEIYVCFSNYLPENIRQIYFPRYQNVTATMDTRAIQREMKKQEVYQYFYQIYQDVQQRETLKMKKSIRGFTLIMQNNTRIPLDILFKNISTDSLVPLIMYSPGKFKENVLRIYSTRISKSGKRIPYLNRSLITTSLRYVKNTTITYFLPRMTEDQYQENMDESSLLNIDLYVRLDSIGNIHIQCDQQVDNVEILNNYILFRVNMLLQKINAFLQKSGYVLPLFDSIFSPFVGIKYFHESWILKSPPNISQNFSILKEIPCISQLFDVYEDNGEQIVLKYKRVYNEEESQSQLIREMLQRSYSTENIIDALVNNYGFTRIQANDRISRYDIEHQARSLYFSPNKEYSFPVEITIDRQQIQIDIFKYCRDCNKMPKDDQERYVVGPKGRIHKKHYKERRIAPLDLPEFFYLTLLEMYVTSILELIYRPNLIAIPPFCQTKTIQEPIEQSTEVFYQEEKEEIPQINLEELDEDVVDVERIDRTPKEVEMEELGIPDVFEEETEAEEEEDDQEEEEEEEEDEEEMFYLRKRGGGPMKRKKETKLSMLQKRDYMFNYKDDRLGTYSRVCQKEKQPVIFDEEEYQINVQKNPDLKTVHYKNPLNTSSQKYWYACPKYWCSNTNMALTEEEVQSGECEGNVVINDKFNNPSFLSKDKHPDDLCLPCCFEGDIEKKPMHQERIKTCQETEQETEQEPTEPQQPYKQDSLLDAVDRALVIGPFEETVAPEPLEKPIEVSAPTQAPTSTSIMRQPSQSQQQQPSIKQRDDKNILRYTQNPPIAQNRRSLLPRIMELFLNIDYSKVIIRNPLRTNIEPNKSTLLLYGIEQPRRQSFLGLLSEIYSTQLNTPTNVQEFRRILIDYIDLDRFVTMYRGSLVSIFYDSSNKTEYDQEKYQNTVLYQSLFSIESMQPSKEISTNFMAKIINSYENFLGYLNDSNTQIDHTYLWELVSTSNLFSKSLNLVIFEITDNKVDVLCPPTPFQSNQEFMFVLKRDAYYEPIYQYSEQEDGFIVKRTFQHTDFLPNSSIGRLIEIIQSSVDYYCQPTVLENQEKYRKNHDPAKLKEILDKYNYEIVYQVWNLHAKLIGFYVRKPGTKSVQLYLPCFPSAPLLLSQPIPIKFIHDSSMYQSYMNSMKIINLFLQETDHELLIEPTSKIIDTKTKQILGIMTETNQMIPVIPVDNTTIEDELPVTKQSNEIQADLEISTNPNPEKTRSQQIRNILLETQFYQVFRSLLRQLLNIYQNFEEKRKILEIIRLYEKDTSKYSSTLKELAILLYDISKEYVSFEDYKDDDLTAISTQDIYSCYHQDQEKTGDLLYCQGRQLIIPKYSLLYDKTAAECGANGQDCSNKNIYYMRMADELLRYRRIQLFMFQPKTFLNIYSGMNEYHLTQNEILLLESSLTDEYFRDMIPFNTSSYIHQTNHDVATPIDVLSNLAMYQPNISLQDQMQFVKQMNPEVKEKMEMTQCIIQTEGGRNNVMGNNRSIWYRSFPKNTQEFFFKNDSTDCTFALVANILRLKNMPIKTIQEIKMDLWRAYQTYGELNQSKIIWLLKQQGKIVIFDKTKDDLEMAIMMDDYYITDLDIWALMTYWNIPVVLFSTGQIKMSMTDGWLYLNTNPNDNDISSLYEPLVFVRSPRMVEQNTYPSYSLIDSLYRIDEMGEIGQQIQSTIQMPDDHVQSMRQLLDKTQVIVKKRGRPKKI